MGEDVADGKKFLAMGYARPTARPATRPVDGISSDGFTLIPLLYPSIGISSDGFTLISLSFHSYTLPVPF